MSYSIGSDAVQERIAKAVAAERSRCAKIARRYHDEGRPHQLPDSVAREAVRGIALTIAEEIGRAGR